MFLCAFEQLRCTLPEFVGSLARHLTAACFLL
jgi:hypothetical protein